MMIRFAFQNGEGAVQLLDENQPHHLMRKRHRRKRHFGVGLGIDILRKSVGTANHKNDALAARSHEFFEIFRKIHRCELLAVFVQKNDVIARLKLRQQQKTLRFFLLLLAQSLAVANVGNLLHLERNVMPKPADILLDAGYQVIFVRFPYDKQ